MKAVWKYPLDLTKGEANGDVVVRMPKKAGLHHVGYQDPADPTIVVLWASVDPYAARAGRTVDRLVQVRGTGHEVDDDELGHYVGTVQHPTGLVWHVFDGGELP